MERMENNNTVESDESEEIEESMESTDFIYSHSKYELGVCELYNSHIHGHTERSYNGIDGHYIIYWLIETESFMTCDDYKFVIQLLLDGYYIYIIRTTHPIIRNYNAIIKRNDYIKLDIIEKVILETGEIIAIIKTFWLRIFQRKWKKYYSELERKIAFNKNIKNRIRIELTGLTCLTYKNK